MRVTHRIVFVLSGALTAGCGSDSGGADEGAAEGSSEASSGADDDAGPGDDDGPDDGTAPQDDDTDDGIDSNDDGTSEDGTEGETDDPPDPSAACEDFELPPRNGAEIIVAPAGDGQVTVDGQMTTLRSVVSGLSSGDTVLLQDGTYTFDDSPDGSYSGLYFTTPDVTLRSMSGEASAVILDSAYVSHGGSTAPITIDAAGVVVADITVQRSIFHLIHLWASGDDAIIHNVNLIDGGQQFVKASPGNSAIVDNVEVSCTSFTMTDAGRDNVWGYGSQDGATTCYTGGIDTHDATNWYVHDSYFAGIYCDASGVQRPAHGRFPEQRDGMTYNGGLAEHCVHMWDSESGSGHVISRNRFFDCARGIGLGFNDQVYGSQILNNMVYSQHAGSGEHDVGISIEEGVDTWVAHNTVFFSHPDAYANRIEYRFNTTTNLTMHGNLTNGEIRARDGAVAADVDNVLVAEATWFVDADAGDLHLVNCDTPGSVGVVGEVPNDFDGDARTGSTTPGADHCSR